MSGREDDDPAADLQKSRRIFQFFSVILDVLQDIDVYDGVELVSFDILQCAAEDLAVASGAYIPDVGSQLLDKEWIGLETDPSSSSASTQVRCVSAKASAHLKDIALQKWLQLAGPIGFPVVYGREEI